MRRIFLVLAVLAILVAAALPAMAQNRGDDNGDNNNWGHNDDWDNNNDWDHNDSDWDNNNWDNHDNDWWRPSYQPCLWSPWWWGWWWNPCYGWWAPWW